MFIVEVSIGGHRHIGQQQTGQVATGLPLRHEQAALGTLAMAALDMKIQPGLQVQLAALRLLT
ncbi:hypothetical protein D3C80_2139970 [compost metagenome]